jgi:hypothetical protein
MRKITLLFFTMILLQACGGVATNTAIPTSTIFITYTLVDTPTTTFTPIPSASPTIVRIPTQDPNSIATFPVIPVFIGDVTATPVVIQSFTPDRPGAGFVDVSVSRNQMYWGGCEANEVTITAEIEDPDTVAGVIIFMRVKSLLEEDYTEWTSGNVMYNNRDGTFTYVAVGSEIEGHNHYKKSAIYFQLVAVDDKGEEVGRTRVYEGLVTMQPCPCLTPITGCPVPTAKPKP